MQRRVLVCPLDWGLGHATRCVPVIRELQEQGCEVLIATSGRALVLLKLEFPGTVTLEIESYNIVYPANGSLAWSLARQFPRIIQTIAKEWQQIQALVEREKIDFIVSDNRFGCWSPATVNVFITHQLAPIPPMGFGWLTALSAAWIRKHARHFQHVWVPDLPDQQFTGRLSDHAQLPVRFVGLLSRMRRPPQPPARRFDLLVLLSGPEPQRTIFEEKLSNALRAGSHTAYVVRGLPGEPDGAVPHQVAHLGSLALAERMDAAEIVICRPGYSTVMDLCALGKKAIFIPTPGQTEQEYLARRYESMKIAFFQEQGNFELKAALHRSHDYSGFSSSAEGSGLLRLAIQQLLRH